MFITKYQTLYILSMFLNIVTILYLNFIKSSCKTKRTFLVHHKKKQLSKHAL